MSKKQEKTTVQKSTAIERLQIATKPYISTTEIAKMLQCSKAKAQGIKMAVFEVYYKKAGKEKKLTPGGREILTRYLLEHLGITNDDMVLAAQNETVVCELSRKARASAGTIS